MPRLLAESLSRQTAPSGAASIDGTHGKEPVPRADFRLDLPSWPRQSSILLIAQLCQRTGRPRLDRLRTTMRSQPSSAACSISQGQIAELRVKSRKDIVPPATEHMLYSVKTFEAEDLRSHLFLCARGR
jgi:hypothetical protein